MNNHIKEFWFGVPLIKSIIFHGQIQNKRASLKTKFDNWTKLIKKKKHAVLCGSYTGSRDVIKESSCHSPARSSPYLKKKNERMSNFITQ